MAKIAATMRLEHVLSEEHVRDSFAGYALMGMLAHSRGNPLHGYRPRDPGEHWHKAIAGEAFDLAEAMMAEQANRPDHCSGLMRAMAEYLAELKCDATVNKPMPVEPCPDTDKCVSEWCAPCMARFWLGQVTERERGGE